jgi:hypothetical protein
MVTSVEVEHGTLVLDINSNHLELNNNIKTAQIERFFFTQNLYIYYQLKLTIL